MPRYFLDIRRNGIRLDDRRGVECPDENSARNEALRTARELMGNHKEVDVSDWSFEIIDAHRRPVMTVLFSEADRGRTR